MTPTGAGAQCRVCVSRRLMTGRTYLSTTKLPGRCASRWLTFWPMTSYCSGARPFASGLGTSMVCTGTTASSKNGASRLSSVKSRLGLRRACAGTVLPASGCSGAAGISPSNCPRCICCGSGSGAKRSRLLLKPLAEQLTLEPVELVLQRNDGRSLGLQQLRDVLRRHRGHRLYGEDLFVCMARRHDAILPANAAN